MNDYYFDYDSEIEEIMLSYNLDEDTEEETTNNNAKKHSVNSYDF